MNKIILFDVDGTITESSQNINKEMVFMLKSLQKKGYELGIVGGGKLNKILEQINNEIYFDHYFSECGSIYHKNDSHSELNLIEIYKKDIRIHKIYKDMNKLIKVALKYLSSVSYDITGHFIDLRNGLIYISLIGLTANINERIYFMELDKKNNYRRELLEILLERAEDLNISKQVSITEGGSVGIAIYPNEYDKTQVLDVITKEKYNEIHYFGDKYEINGNDYKIITHKNVIGHCVNNPNDTIELLKKF